MCMHMRACLGIRFYYVHRGKYGYNISFFAKFWFWKKEICCPKLFLQIQFLVYFQLDVLFRFGCSSENVLLNTFSWKSKGYWFWKVWITNVILVICFMFCITVLEWWAAVKHMLKFNVISTMNWYPWFPLTRKDSWV